jgi:hypothetical protein
VCKGWRSLRHEAPLWRAVALETPEGASKKASPWIAPSRWALFLGAGGAPRAPVRDARCVQALTLGGDAAGADDFKRVLTKVPLPALRELRLHGKKISTLVLKAAAKHVGATLTSFTLGRHSSKLGFDDVLDLISCAPSLTALSLEGCLSAEGALALGRRASSARSGGASLLRSLTLSGSVWDGSYLAARALGALGGAAPELEALCAERLCALSHVSPASPPFAPLRRLAALRLGGVSHTLSSSSEAYANRDAAPYAYTHASEAAGFEATLARLVSAALALVDLDVCARNERGYGFDGANAVGHMRLGAALGGVLATAAAAAPSSSAPSAAAASSSLPLQALQRLRLAAIEVNPDCITPVAALPALRSLTLDGCGDGALGAAVAIAALAPELRDITVTSTDSSRALMSLPLHASAEALVQPLAALAAPRLTTLKLHLHFPPVAAHGDADADAAPPPAPAPAAAPITHLAGALRALAASGGVPSLQHLSLHIANAGAVTSTTALVSCFAPQPSGAWAQLRTLRLEGVPAVALPALLRGLTAPTLTSLALEPHISAEGTTVGAVPAPAAAAYKDVRARAPLLPALHALSKEAAAAAGSKDIRSLWASLGGASGSGGAGADAMEEEEEDASAGPPGAADSDSE